MNEKDGEYHVNISMRIQLLDNLADSSWESADYKRFSSFDIFMDPATSKNHTGVGPAQPDIRVSADLPRGNSVLGLHHGEPHCKRANWSDECHPDTNLVGDLPSTFTSVSIPWRTS